MSDKISVILPCLNMADYIGLCLKSVSSQTYKNMEIIVVDAGSTDGTLDIVQKHMNVDSRIRILHSNKKSYGYQVNLGLKESTGEFIGVVDTDDLLVEDAYEKLLDVIVDNELDYVKGYARMFYYVNDVNKAELDICNFYFKDGICGEIVCPQKMPELIVKDHFLWNGLYRKSFLKSIRLNETKGAAFQDQGFCLQVYLKASRAMYIDQLVYLYRQDNENSSTFNKNGFSYTLEEFTLNERFLENHNIEWYSYFYYRMWHQCLGRFDQMVQSGMYWEESANVICELKRKLTYAVKQGYINQNVIVDDKDSLFSMFLVSEKQLFDMLYKEKQQLYCKIADLVTKLKDKAVVIVGCGAMGKFLSCLLIKNGIKIKSFIDNNSKLHGMEYNDIVITSMENGVNDKGNICYVIAGKQNSNELKLQLSQFDVNSEDIFFYNSGCRFELLKKTY